MRRPACQEHETEKQLKYKDRTKKMKRQATKYLALTISAIMAVSLTACGDGSDSSADAALTPVEAEPILSDLELEILNLETKYKQRRI